MSMLNMFKKNLFQVPSNGGEVEDNASGDILQYFSSLALYHPDLSIIFSPKGEIISQNGDKNRELLGFQPKKIEDVIRLFPKETQRRLNTTFNDTLKGKTERMELDFTKKGGQLIHLLLTFIPITLNNNEVQGVYLQINDITEQVTIKKELILKGKHLSHAQEIAEIGSWEYVIDGDQLLCSDKFLEIFGLEQSEYITMDQPFNLVHPDDYDMAWQFVKNSVEKGMDYATEFRIYHGRTKELRHIGVQAECIKRNNKPYKIVGVVKDFSREMEMREKLEQITNFDPLTHLPNQQHLYETLDHLCQNDDPFAVLYLDINRLHIINYSLGSRIGDELLKNITNKLKVLVPDDGFISRINSNDFVIVLEKYKDKEFIYQLAEKIINQIQKIVTINEYDLQITSSIGISFFPDNGKNKLNLIENAHAALLRAKRQGKNNYKLYSNLVDIPSYKKYVMEKDMRKAIMNEEFEIYYQPQVNTGGIIYGAEALLRWNHEEWGLISPGEFIPLAEENHLINHLSDWVIKTVCAQLREWKEKKITLRPIAINLSPIRFMKSGLVEFVKKQLELHQIPAKYLEFEITESSILRNEVSILSTLDGLRKIGVSIAIDDFGTGYSSLQYLHDFKVDTIKIDRVFLNNLHEENKANMVIISSILQLAKGLGLKIVAEGVEEYEQYEFLKQKECDIIQGYLFSKPVPLPKFEQMLQTGYLKPKKDKIRKVPEEERRKYFRFEFPYSLLGTMTVKEVKKKKVNLGATPILIQNISIGGLKFLSSLKLPVNADIKYVFAFSIMDESFEIDGKLMWKNEAKGNTFYYGVDLMMNLNDEVRLAALINRMSTFQNMNQEVPGTDFVYEDAFSYLRKHFL